MIKIGTKGTGLLSGAPAIEEKPDLADHGLRQAALANASDILALPDDRPMQAGGTREDALANVGGTSARSGPQGSEGYASARQKFASNCGRTREDMERDWEVAQKAALANVP